ncbi:MAG: hypothetical protein Greene101449_1395, partial [Candidatus Peregrinibacteria bacterium Greene1014_49]
IIGREKVMTVAQDTFISSTNWTERIGPTAAIAMIKKYRRENVHKHLIRMGTMVQQGWKDAATKSGISVHVDGLPPLAHFTVQTEQQPAAHTFFAQEMLKRGFLVGQVFYATYAHTGWIADAKITGSRAPYGVPPAHVIGARIMQLWISRRKSSLLLAEAD